MVDDITTCCAEVASFGKTLRIQRPKNCDKIAKLRKCRIMKALKSLIFLKSKKDAFMLKKVYNTCYTLKQAKQNATYNPTLFFSCF